MSFSTFDSGSTLDLVITRENADIVKNIRPHDPIADHVTVLFTLSVLPLVPPTGTRTTRDIRRMNFHAFCSNLQNSTVFTAPASDVDTYTEQIKTCVTSALDSVAPLIEKPVRKFKPSPWMTGDARRAKASRRRCERRWRRSRSDIDKQLYSKACKAANYLITKARTDHLNKSVADCTGQPKKLWKTVTKLLHNTKCSNLAFESADVCRTACDNFCMFFMNKVTSIYTNIATNRPVCDPLVQQPYTGATLTSFTPVTSVEVLNLIHNMPLSACTLDFVPPSLIKSCSSLFEPMITRLANLSLESGVFPDMFKLSQITPLLKKPNLSTSDPQNFRPVANLNSISKIIERLVLTRMLLHIAPTNNCNPFQSAYKKHHSTESALLCILDDLHSEMDKSHLSLLVALDLSAAFDTIDHATLLHRLSDRFGLRDKSLAWFKSYLSNRSQFVHISGSSSFSLPCPQGVPQGSVLGPLLFSLYIAPVADLILSSGLKCHQYADDTQLYISFAAKDLLSGLKIVEDCTLSIRDWLAFNFLQLNPTKSEALLVGSSQQLSKINHLDTVMVAGAPIKFASNIKNLGVYIDSSLTLNHQVTQQCKTCYYHIRQLKHIRPFLSEAVTNTISQAITFSSLDYCNSLLSHTSQANLHKLQRVQNCLARVVSRPPRLSSITNVRKTLHWLPVESRIKYKTALITFKTLTTGEPQYLASRISRYVPSRNLRSSTQNLLVQPRTRLVSTTKSFSYSAPDVWNSLPESVKLTPSIDSFKRSLKTHLFTLAYP